MIGRKTQHILPAAWQAATVADRGSFSDWAGPASPAAWTQSEVVTDCDSNPIRPRGESDSV